MSKVPTINLRREDFPDLTTGDRVDRLLRSLNQYGGEAQQLFRSALVFGQNASTRDVTISESQDWPVKVRNDLGAAPRHVLLTRLVSIADGKETPVAGYGPAWSAGKDQILIHSIGNVSPGTKYRATLLVVAE